MSFEDLFYELDLLIKDTDRILREMEEFENGQHADLQQRQKSS